LFDFVEPTKVSCEVVEAEAATDEAGIATAEAVALDAVLAVFQDCFSVETE